MIALNNRIRHASVRDMEMSLYKLIYLLTILKARNRRTPYPHIIMDYIYCQGKQRPVRPPIKQGDKYL